MSRPVEQYGELVNGDSFLDIVSSVIGIMLIMVVFVGVKIKRGPVNVLLPPSPVEADLAKDAAEEEALRGDVWKMSEEIRSLEHETAVRDLQRKMLFQPFGPKEDLVPCLREAGNPRHIVGNLHGGRCIQEEDHGGLLAFLPVEVDHRTEKKQNHNRNGQQSQNEQ